MRAVASLSVAAFTLSGLGCSKLEKKVHVDDSAPTAADEAFCAPSFAALPGACTFVPSSIVTPPTLVYYAHGMLAEGAAPSHELAIVRAAAESYGFVVLAPRGRKGLCTWSAEVVTSTCWPARRDAVDAKSKEILGGWIGAEHRLAKSLGTRFSRHYAVGFSNGGYFVSYVAADGLLKLDGAAVIGAGRSDIDDGHLAQKIPFFVGVGSEEASFTLDAAANLARDLAAREWPIEMTVYEGRGHQISEDDFDLAWLTWSR